MREWFREQRSCYPTSDGSQIQKLPLSDQHIHLEERTRLGNRITLQSHMVYPEPTEQELQTCVKLLEKLILKHLKDLKKRAFYTNGLHGSDGLKPFNICTIENSAVNNFRKNYGIDKIRKAVHLCTLNNENIIYDPIEDIIISREYKKDYDQKRQPPKPPNKTSETQRQELQHQTRLQKPITNNDSPVGLPTARSTNNKVTTASTTVLGPPQRIPNPPAVAKSTQLRSAQPAKPKRTRNAASHMRPSPPSPSPSSPGNASGNSRDNSIAAPESPLSDILSTPSDTDPDDTDDNPTGALITREARQHTIPYSAPTTVDKEKTYYTPGENIPDKATCPICLQSDIRVSKTGPAKGKLRLHSSRQGTRCKNQSRHAIPTQEEESRYRIRPAPVQFHNVPFNANPAMINNDTTNVNNIRDPHTITQPRPSTHTITRPRYSRCRPNRNRSLQPILLMYYRKIRELDNTDLLQEPAQYDKLLQELVAIRPPNAIITPTVDNSDVYFAQQTGTQPTPSTTQAAPRLPPPSPVDNPTTTDRITAARNDHLATPNVTDQVFKQILKAINNNQMGKARAMLTSQGLLSISDSSVMTSLLSKYQPVTTDADTILEWNSNTDRIEFEASNEITAEELTANILSAPQGKAAGISGMSIDDLKLMFIDTEQYPHAAEYMAALLNNMAGNRIPEGEGKRSLIIDRGIYGKKNNKDGRPIAINGPEDKLTAMCLSTKLKYKAVDICGNSQVGNAISGGIEAAIHTINGLLHETPNYMVCKIDVTNAFNSVNRKAMLAMIKKHLPEAYPYAYFRLAQPSYISYHDFKTELTKIIQYSRGVTQGNAMSTIFFNIAQKDALDTVREAFQHDNITLISCHDDHHIVGPPTLRTFAAVQALLTQLQETLDLDPSPTKLAIYSQHELPQDVQNAARLANFQVIPPEQGFIILGAPIGSTAYKTTYVTDLVNKVSIESMSQIRNLITREGSTLKIQHAYTIFRTCLPSQLNFLLRVLPPSITMSAACLFDEQFMNNVFQSMGIASNLDIVDFTIAKFYLPLRSGGGGMTATQVTANTAYVSSIALCASQIKLLQPSLVCTDISLKPNSFIAEFKNLLTDFQQKFNILMLMNLTNLWEKPHPHLQQLLKKKIDNTLNTNFIARITDHCSGPDIYNKIKDDEIKALAIGMNRALTANGYLSATPKFQPNHMTNLQFRTAICSSLLIPTIPTHETRYCPGCGTIRLDTFGHHPLHCSNVTIRNKLRNTWHNKIKNVLTQQINTILRKNHPAAICISIPEPHMSTMFQYIGRDNNSDSTFIPHVGIRPVQEKRADGIIIFDGNPLDPRNKVWDLTSTHNVGVQYNSATTRYDTAGKAATIAEQKKLEKYSQLFNITDPATPYFTALAFETTGAIGSDTKTFFKWLCNISPQEEFPRNQQYDQLLQTISVELHKARHAQLEIIKQSSPNLSNLPPTPTSPITSIKITNTLFSFLF